jgi:glycosyltransferase involved in cell wall biosynthesis
MVSTVAASTGFDALIRKLQPSVVHVHGLDFPADVAVLRGVLPDRPILVQDHASRPPRLWRRRTWRRGLAVASAIAFCSREQSRPFARAGLIGARTQVCEIPESSSRFTPGAQAQARARTQLTGDPAVLWVGHLDANKDPLTVLDGLSEAGRSLPNLQLWCCFGKAPLWDAVTSRIARDPRLNGRVHLLGTVPHAEIEHMMRAANFFVAGSRREGSGYALIEALACGLPPVVTNIPSFRALTGDGAVGELWPCGSAQSLSEALLAIASQPREALRLRVRAHFEGQLSLEALGQKLAQTYRGLCA